MDNKKYEKDLIMRGYKCIAGIDEVGRGPLVGPVVSACVVLPNDFKLDGLTDSKKLSEKKREKFYDIIINSALGVGIGIVDEKRIDEINIYNATKESMIIAFNSVKCNIDYVLVDAMPLELNVEVLPIIKGDLKSITIAAASVIAKVTRDRMMCTLEEKYPMYNFKKHKGYPTKTHLLELEKYGVLSEHRKSYGPVKNILEKIKY